MAITPLPTPPARTQTSDVFADNADAFLAALPTFGSEANALQTNVNNKEASATTSASNAATSEGNAANSASAASTSETNAADSATAAQGFRDTTQTLRDDVLARFIGNYASDTDANDSGFTIAEGIFYWNTTTPGLRIYDGANWGAAVLDPSGALMAVNNLSDIPDQPTARSSLGLGTAAVEAATAFAKSQWAAKTAAYTASAGDRLQADTSGGAFTITLPASPAAGYEVWLADPGANWATNNLTVDGNGNNIAGAATFTGDLDKGHFIAVYNGTAWVVRFTGGDA